MYRIGIPLLTAVLTMAIFYGIGVYFDLSIMRFHMAFDSFTNGGFVFEADIALLPFAIGVVSGLITERVVKKQLENRTNRHEMK